jgi:NADPH:quinone reductase-like Zn-dependent oxidoreductase
LPVTTDVVLHRTDQVLAVEADERETRMRAVVYDRYGPPEVLRLEDVARPVPHGDEILIRIHATTVNRGDCGERSGTRYISRFLIPLLSIREDVRHKRRVLAGALRPKRPILGCELAGEVEAVGAAVSEFQVGDRVFGMSPFGAHAEFVCVRESGPVARMPTGVSFEDAAAVCDGAILALGSLRHAGLRTGQRILVYGASGSIGTAGVQLAKHFEADVTAVCNTKNVELVTSLGADEVIDYLEEDFTKNGKTYDVIFDAVGKHSFRRCRRSLTRDGKFIATDLGFMWHVPFLLLLTKWVGNKSVVAYFPRYTKTDILFLRQLLEAGTYRTVIDRCYPLEDVVEATTYVETGQKTGNVVLTVDGSRAR